MNPAHTFKVFYLRTKIKLIATLSIRKAAKIIFKSFVTPFYKVISKQPIKNAEPIQFLLNKKIINGYQWNTPQTKKILILHGFGSAAYKFKDYATMLSDKGFEVLAFDAPAHGKSDGKTTNAVEYSEMIKMVIDKFGPIPIFLAHSFGGMALSLALENVPHNKNTKVIFIAPATETTTAIDGAFNLLKLKNKVLRMEFEKIIFEISGQQTEWFSIRRAMHNIKASVLWIHDEDDDTTPWADALKVKEDNHNNIKFVLTKGLGHRKIYHHKETKNKVLEFIEND